MLRDCIRDRLLAFLNFFLDTRSRLQGQQGVGKGMISDRMPLLCDLARDVRPLPHVLANQKKCCANVMLG